MHSNKRIALTIDDLPFVTEDTGEGIEITDLLLQRLRENDVKATGFVVGRFVEEKDAVERFHLLEKWRSEGHLLANHTWSHKSFNEQSFEEFEQDVIKNEELIAPLLGTNPESRRYFRFPYMEYGNSAEQRDKALDWLHKRSYTDVPVNLDTKDYLFNDLYINGDKQVADQYLERLEKVVALREQQAAQSAAGQVKLIMLIHANRLNADCLNRVIAFLKQQEYVFVSLQEVLQKPAYQQSLALPYTNKLITENRETPKSTQTTTVNHIALSVIVPVYNAEEYLPECIDSLLQQHGIRLEIILIDDGSTDRSGAMADAYAQQYSCIKVIHRANGGASAARNTGLDVAQGEYIVFVDSDDWVKKDSLVELYHTAVNYQADVVMGNLLYSLHHEIIDGPYKPASMEIRYIPFSGREGFIRLGKVWAYAPMACNYIYSRKHLETIHARFEEGIMAEDELWTPVVLCQAGKMVIVDIDFYYYRQRDGSVMHTTSQHKRLDSMFCVIDRLIEFAERSDFPDEDGELKNWWSVNILRLYISAFMLLPKLNDTSYVVPAHHPDRFRFDDWPMTPKFHLCSSFYRNAKLMLKQYTGWGTSGWGAMSNEQLIMNNEQRTMGNEQLTGHCMDAVYPLVSVIIPVYNTEDYLEECLNSVVNQTYQQIEIILVNDGSTDRSQEIMEGFARKDKRMILLSQSNRGVSAARNAGLSVAKGEYIFFVDSDDTIRTDSVEMLCRQAVSTGADIVLGNLFFCYPDGRQNSQYRGIVEYATQPVLSGKHLFSQLMQTTLFPPMVFLYFTKRTFVVENQLFFKEGIIHEDELWCIQALVLAPQVSIVDFFYNKRLNYLRIKRIMHTFAAKKS